MPQTDDQFRTKDCPVCGETMRLRTRELSERIPGSSQIVKHVVKEWECADCSYEEEYEDEE